MKEHLGLIALFGLLIFFVLLLVTSCANPTQKVELISQSQFPLKSIYPDSPDTNQKLIKLIHFDDNNLPHLSNDPVDKSLPGVCNPNPVGSYGVTLLLHPRVEQLFCPAKNNDSKPQLFLLGLDNLGKQSWLYPLSKELGSKYQWIDVVGATKSGIILYSFVDNQLKIISPNTGQQIFPLNDTYKISYPTSFTISNALYLPQTNSIFAFRYEDQSSNEIIRIDLTNSKIESTVKLRSQSLTNVNSFIKSMTITKNNRYLIFTDRLTSRLGGSSSQLNIYDLEKRNFIFHKTLDLASDSLVETGQDDHFALFHTQHNFAYLEHYVIKPK